MGFDGTRAEMFGCLFSGKIIHEMIYCKIRVDIHICLFLQEIYNKYILLATWVLFKFKSRLQVDWLCKPKIVFDYDDGALINQENVWRQ